LLIIGKKSTSTNGFASGKNHFTGLPDGMCISNQKSQFGLILEGLAMEDIGIFYGHLVYFEAIWYILRQFGIICGHLVYFAAIWYILWLFSPILVR
jgi:hypothetical protein